MKGICTGCLCVYEENLIGTKCSKRNCEGEVIKIEDSLVPVVKLLMEKGYYVKAEKSGYKYLSSDYIPDALSIVFEEYVNLLSKPQDMEFIEKENKITITFDNETKSQALNSVYNNLKNIINWIQELPIQEYQECVYSTESDYRKCQFCNAVDACISTR